MPLSQELKNELLKKINQLNDITTTVIRYNPDTKERTLDENFESEVDNIFATLIENCHDLSDFDDAILYLKIATGSKNSLKEYSNFSKKKMEFIKKLKEHLPDGTDLYGYLKLWNTKFSL